MGNIARCVVVAAILVGGSVTADTTRPAVKGKTVTLVPKKPVALGGLSISFTRASHKHDDGGGSLGMWFFAIKKGAKSEEIELRSNDQGFQAEVAVHGAALVFQHVEYEKFTVTLAAQKAPKPLDEDACAAKIVERATKQGLTEGNHRSWSMEHGIVVLNDETWRGSCGTLTRRVWIESPYARKR
ncbi:MAG: hypothetical protein AB7T06_24460 [Kofleriaceae bacterium]